MFRYFKVNYKQMIFLLLIPLMFFYNINFLSNIFQPQLKKSLISCYFQNKYFDSLPELSPNEITKNSIFFIETSCNHNNGYNLNLRQSCAVESAAKLNPNLKIFVLFVAPSFINYESDALNTLRQYSNVNLRYINFVKYAYNTPLQEFVASNKILTSNWPVTHASDLLRFLTLWKFGGTYLDLDVILLKSLEGLSNFACMEKKTLVASCVLNFGTDDIGKNIANITINDFVENYKGDEWGYNGPGVITRSLEKFCQAFQVTQMTKQKCKGFDVYEPEKFCPIGWRYWMMYFDGESREKVFDLIKNSMGIHLWNKFSKYRDIIVGSQQPYGLIAQKNCPNIYSLVKYVF